MISRVFQDADAEAYSTNITILDLNFLGVGSVFSTAEARGSTTTHVDGTIGQADRVVLLSHVLAEADSLAEANGFSLVAGGAGGDARATVGDPSPAQMVSTFVAGAGTSPPGRTSRSRRS